MEDELNALKAICSDIMDESEDLVNYAIRIGLRDSHFDRYGARIWRAILKLKYAKRPLALTDVAKVANEEQGDTVAVSTLTDWASEQGVANGCFLIQQVVARALLKDAWENPVKVDVDGVVKRLAMLQEQGGPPIESLLEDGGALMESEFPPLEWLVRDIIPKQGVMLLAGRPKLGKSWLALQAAHRVCTGQDFFGHSTAQGTVLYLALEDGQRRTQRRLKEQSWTVSEARSVFFGYELPGGLDPDGLDRLRIMIEQTEPALVVLDALAKVLPKGIKENVAEDMARVLYPLSDLANRAGCAMLVVHHHRKGAGAERGFVGEDIRGSSAILAAVDGVISLYREGRATEARLSVLGRDMEDTEFAIGFTGSGWTHIGGVEILGQREKKRKVIDALKEMGEATAKDIAKDAGISVQWAKKVLEEVVKDGYATTLSESTKGRATTVYVWHSE